MGKTTPKGKPKLNKRDKKLKTGTILSIGIIFLLVCTNGFGQAGKIGNMLKMWVWSFQRDTRIEATVIDLRIETVRKRRGQETLIENRFYPEVVAYIDGEAERFYPANTTTEVQLYLGDTVMIEFDSNNTENCIFEYIERKQEDFYVVGEGNNSSPTDDIGGISDE